MELGCGDSGFRSSIYQRPPNTAKIFREQNPGKAVKSRVFGHEQMRDEENGGTRNETVTEEKEVRGLGTRGEGRATRDVEKRERGTRP